MGGERVRVLEAVGAAVRAVGAGGAGGRAGAAIEHYSSLFFGGASLFLGGKEDMWAVRAGCGWAVSAVRAQCGRWGR